MATLKEIAKKTNLTVSTVSDILNDRPKARYSEATRELVHAAAKEIGYSKNRLAHGAMRGCSHMIGILVPDMSNPFYVALLQRITPALREADYTPLVQEVPPCIDPEAETQALKALSEFRVDGIIAFSIHGTAHNTFYRQQLKGGRPIVGIGLPADPSLSGLSTVGIDFEEGIRQAVAHLFERGHRKYAFLGNFPWDQKLGRRWEIINASLNQLGLSGQPQHRINCEHSMIGSTEAMEAFLKRTDRSEWPTAVFALNDNLAIGAIRALKDAGLRIPEDVAVVGFDNTPIARHLPVSLSSIGCRLRDIGQYIAETILWNLQHKKEFMKHSPKTQVFTAEFHARETS